jgi:putative SbcD/Mre11-related phosphoesterase
MRFLAGHPAAQLGDALVIADLHLGIEFELRKRGVRAEPQPRRLADLVNALIQEADARELLILGDAKHDVHGLWERERRAFLEFLAHLDADRLTVVKGNHDGHLQSLPGKFQGKEFSLEPPDGILREEGGKRYLLFHGHAWPSKELLARADVLLMGHSHPLVEFRDRLGAVHRERAWILGESKGHAESGVRAGTRYVILPAFNPLSGGYAFNRSPAPPPEEWNGPLLAGGLLNLEEAEARLLTGASLGRLGALRKFTAGKRSKRFKASRE